MPFTLHSSFAHMLHKYLLFRTEIEPVYFGVMLNQCKSSMSN